MNKSIDEYTIRCTAEQAKKALELGASIEFEQTFCYNWKDGKREPYPDIETDKDGEPILIKPTSEQMIGWLEDQGLNFEGSSYYMSVEIKNGERIGIYSGTRKSSTLAAIDAALEYLSNNKNNYEKSII